MREYLEQQIAARQQRLNVLDKERSTIESELRAYTDALLQAGGSVPFASTKSQPKCASLSRAWIAIFQQLLGYKHFNASEIMLASIRLHREKVLKKKQTSGSARAQLSLLTAKEIINRRGGGNYSFSEETRLWLQAQGSTSNTSAQLNGSSPKTFGPELAAQAQERRVTPANPRPREGET